MIEGRYLKLLGERCLIIHNSISLVDVIGQIGKKNVNSVLGDVEDPGKLTKFIN